jgi:hypothetical protein
VPKIFKDENLFLCLSDGGGSGDLPAADTGSISGWYRKRHLQ